jgi:hypothetical protein
MKMEAKETPRRLPVRIALGASLIPRGGGGWLACKASARADEAALDARMLTTSIAEIDFSRICTEGG